MKYLPTTLLLLSLAIALLWKRARKTKTEFANIGEGTRETGYIALLGDANAAPLTGATTTPTTNGRFLLAKKSTDGDHWTTCTINDVSIGVAQDVYDPSNTDVPINIRLHAAPGTGRVQTDGTITDGVPIKAGALGQATAATSGDAGIFGRAIIGTDTTANAGDVITYVGATPFKYSF
jgi:hypothetical protein